MIYLDSITCLQVVPLKWGPFALGIMPYISASIIMQLMGAVFPTLARLQQEGEPEDRKFLNTLATLRFLYVCTRRSSCRRPSR